MKRKWMMAKACVALGSNLGDRPRHLEEAVRQLRALPRTRVVRVSRWYETAAVGGPAGQDDFLNGAALVETELTSRELLTELLRMEREAGRDRSDEAMRWGPRPLDLDLLLYGEQVKDEPGLTLPHPRMGDRWFVLRPLADIAPEMMHPTSGRTVAQLLAAIRGS